MFQVTEFNWIYLIPTALQAPRSKRKRQYSSVGVMHTGQRLVLMTASVIQLKERKEKVSSNDTALFFGGKAETTNRLQKICPHMLAVMSSHESAKHTRQCNGFGLTTEAVIGVNKGVVTAVVVWILFD